MSNKFFSGKVSEWFKNNIAKPISTGWDKLINSNPVKWIKNQVEAATGDKANTTNKELGEANLDFQRENFEYEKALQEELFEREDTSYQRTVNDMRLAGLNPLNMQSTNKSGEAIATSAPQNNYQEQPTRTLELLNNLFNVALSTKTTVSNSSLNDAQANLLNAQADNQRIKNIYENDLLQSTVTDWFYKNRQNWFNTDTLERNYLFNHAMGYTENMPDWLKRNAARFGYRPFNMPLETNYKQIGSEPWSYWYKNNNPNFNINPDMQIKLLEDDLFSGTVSIFDRIIQGLTF